MRIGFRRIFTLFLAVALGVAGLFGLLNSARALSPGVSFGAVNLSTWQTNGTVWDLGTAQGLVFAGGSFTQLRPPDGAPGSTITRPGLVVLHADTGAPASCQFTVAGLSSRVRTIEASPDGQTVWIAGEFSTINGVSRNRLAALNVSSCSVRTTFNAGAIGAEIFDLSFFGNTLYLGGGFSTVAGETRQYFAAVNATTGAVLPWTADSQSYQGAGVNKRGRAIEVSPDGQKVVVGGYIYYVEGVFSHSIAVLSSADSSQPGGELLRTYPQGFIPGNPNATSTTTDAPNGTSATHAITNGQGDGRFYIGNEGIGGGVFDGRAAFRWSDGEQVWRDTCLGATQDIIEDNGTLYAVHHTHDCSGINEVQDGRRFYLSAQSTDTMEHYGWKPDLNDGLGENIGPRALSIATAGAQRYLWVGGEFTRVNSSPQQGLTRFSDVSAAPGTPSIVPTAMSNGTIQVRVRSVVDNDDSHLTYRVYRNASTTAVWEGTAVSFWWKRPQLTFVDSNVTPGQLYTYRVEVTDGVHTRTSGTIGIRPLTPSSDYRATVIADQPARLYWDSTMTGTSTETGSGAWLHDVSAGAPQAAGRNGIAMRGVVRSTDGAVPADTTGSLLFDGVDDYVWNDQIAPGPTVYSIETWFKTTTTRGGKIVGFGNGRPRTDTNATVLSSSYDRHIYMLNNGRVRFGVWTGSASTITSSRSYNDGLWHHAVATQGPGGMSLWVDGERLGTNGTTTAQGYYGVWHVGGDQLNGWPDRPASNFFAGQIDETAIYDSVLSRQQIINHAQLGGKTPSYNASPTDTYGAAVYANEPDFFWRLSDATTTAADASYFGQTPGTYTAGVTRNVTGLVDGAASFAGNQNSTVATATQLTPPSAYSLQLWFKAPSTGRGKLVGFENQQTGSGSSYDKQVYLANDGRLIFGVYTGSAQTITSTASYNDDAWHLLTATQDASGMKLYVDGSLVASNAVSGSETGAGYWRLGGGNLSSWPNRPSNDYFSGQIDEFAVYSRALPAQVIQDHFLIVNPDSQPPTVPNGVSVDYVAPDVEISWTASTDNVGVTAYSVHRAAAADFPADETTEIGRVTTDLGTPRYLDEAPGVGTWFYKVRAEDGRENRSDPSLAVSVDVLDDVAPARPETTGSLVEPLPDVPTPGDAREDVSLSWAATTDNVGVLAYRVHRGDAAGFMPDAGNLLTEITVSDPSQPSYSYADPNPPQGELHYAVLALDAAGNASEPGLWPPVSIPDTVAPDAVTGLTATVTEGQVALAWDEAQDNVGVTAYVLHRSAEAAFEPSAATQVGNSTTLTYTDAAPAGTWFYRVTATDAAGNVGAASNAAQVTVLDTLPPTTPTATVEVAGTDATLSWTASEDNTAVVGYRLYRGASPDITAETGTPLGEVTVTTYTDGGLTPGTYYYRVAAFDAAGNVSELSAPAEAVVAAPDTEAPSTPAGVAATVAGAQVNLMWSASSDNVAVVAYEVHRGTTEGFPVGAGSKIADVAGTTYEDAGLEPGTYYYAISAADAAGNVSAASEVVSASVSAEPVDPVTITLDLSDDAGVVESSPTTNYGTGNQLFSRGTGGGQQSFLLLPLPEAPAGTVLATASLRLRTSTDSAAASTDAHTVDLVTGAWTESGVTWNNRPTTAAANLGSIAPVTARNTPFEVSLNSAVVAANLGSAVTARISGSGADNLRLWSAEASVATYRPQVVLEFVDAGGEPPADTQAPSTPAGLTATPSGQDVTLQWAAASDDVGVTAYEVFRGATAGFTADATTLIASTAATTHVDLGLAPGTWHYRVLAKDAAGNRSEPSVSASVVVEDPGTPTDPVTLEVSTSADAGVISTAPGTNYGSSNQLFSSNAASAQESFLQFELPAAPAGQQLTGAVLRFRTSTDAAAGSAGVHDVHVMDGAWTEASVTWSSRPTAALAQACSISGASERNTAYTAECDAATLTAGSVVTLRISSSSTDNLRMWSKEGPASQRPTLVLTYS